MGPLALLDLVGLDVAQSIGNTIGADVPERIDALVAEGALGRKSGRGFYLHVTSAKASGEARSLQHEIRAVGAVMFSGD